MPDLERLNVHVHHALRVAGPTATGRHFVQIVGAEFESAAARLPILFAKNPETGAFYAGVVLGFRPGENVVADTADAADADALHDLTRAGFYIVGDDIAIDRTHPRFAADPGQPLFADDDRPTPTLRRIQRALAALHAGLPQTNAFLQRLLARKLVEPIDLSFSFDDGERLSLDGLYTVSRDALADIDDATALDLFRRGDLALVHAAIGSLHHLSRLARMRNDRLSAA